MEATECPIQIHSLTDIYKIKSTKRNEDNCRKVNPKE